jgi:putative peptide zinc metalloprotease protein
MPTLADSLQSTSARRLGLRKRPDLTAKKQHYQGRIYWVIKEPIGLNYFRFQEEEFALLEMLDGSASLDDLKRRFEERFAPEQISVAELGQFVGMLHRSGLVIADMPGQGVQLYKRRNERWWQELWGTLSNVLAVRFKGIDPERILNWIYPKVRWFFTTAAVLIFCTIILSAVTLVAVQFDVFYAKLPTFHQFFQKGNWIWLGLVLAVTKVLHEFGHGLSCKHFGGECHEMGFMLLVLTPALYCNVSDSWMLHNKWHRAAIGAAGMYVELVIAAFATYVWWFTEPGLLNQVALNAMFVCSVSTIMFNGNPLLRYDGYYILSDLTEIPNLRQKATTILSRKLGSWCLGLEEPDDPFLPQRNQIFFALYSVASSVYSWFVTLSILWFLQKVFEPYGLQIIGQLIGLAAIGGLVVRPLWQLLQYFRVPGRMEQIDKSRFKITLCVAAGVLVFILFVPLPYRIFCSVDVEARDAETVYVEVPGTLVELLVKPGQAVEKGQLLARLDNVDLRLSVADLKGRHDQLQSQLDSLLRERYRDPQANQEVPRVQESLDAVTDQLREREADIKHLELHASQAGYVIPPVSTPAPQPDADRLATWSDTPLDQHNIGATFRQGVPFCQIGDPKKMQAALVIDQADIEFVAVGRPVTINLDELPGDRFSSKITEISKLDLKYSPRELSHKTGGELDTKTDAAGQERPMNTSYQALAPLDDEEEILRVGLRGRGKISASHWISLSGRAWRAFSQTFNFRL